MPQNMYRLVSQIDLLETMCELPLGLTWVQQAIRDAAQEIERSEPDDMAASYARDIATTLGEVCTGTLAPTLSIASSRLGDQIRMLGQYVESLGNGSRPGKA